MLGCLERANTLNAAKVTLLKAQIRKSPLERWLSPPRVPALALPRALLAAPAHTCCARTPGAGDAAAGSSRSRCPRVQMPPCLHRAVETAWSGGGMSRGRVFPRF